MLVYYTQKSGHCSVAVNWSYPVNMLLCTTYICETYIIP